MSAGPEAPKFEIHEGGQDILKGYADRMSDVKKEYDKVQEAYNDIKGRLDELTSRRWFGLRAPELDKNAAPRVMENLKSELDKIFQDFRAEIKQAEISRKYSFDKSLADIEIKGAYMKLRADLSKVLNTLMDQWVAEAKIPSKKNPETVAKIAQQGVSGERTKRGLEKAGISMP